MSLEQPSATEGLIARIKGVLMTPQAEFDKIAAEQTDVQKLYVGYAVPLAALAAICGAIGMTVFGMGGFGFVLRYTPVQAVVGGVVQFAIAIGSLFLMGIIVNALAPNFGSVKDQIQAHKLAVYGATASFLAGVFAIFPPIAMLGILGLYSLFLFYIGLPRLMKTPEDKRLPYFLTIIVVYIVVAIVLGIVSSTVMAATGFRGPSLFGGGGFASSSSSNNSNVDAEITLPGGGTLNVQELERQAKQAQDAMENGQSVTVDPARLQALLPDSLPGGFSRTSISSTATGQMGAGAASAEAIYERGEARITLTVGHLGGLAGLSAMAGAVGVQSNTETPDGYERMNTVDGRAITEELSRSANSVEYAIIGRNGAMLGAQGRGVTMEEARAAVNAVGVERVEALGAT